jgi:hypothetical protein
MIGLLAVEAWEKATFHFLYHMNIIIETHFNSPMENIEANNT